MDSNQWMATADFFTFFDPISPWFTDPNNHLSPLSIDPSRCIQVQGVCLVEQPYALGTTIFWGIAVPSSSFYPPDLWT